MAQQGPNDPSPFTDQRRAGSGGGGTGAVDSVSGLGDGILVQPTTGNVVVQNTGVVELLAGNGISLDDNIGVITVTATGTGGPGGNVDFNQTTGTGIGNLTYFDGSNNEPIDQIIQPNSLSIGAPDITLSAQQDLLLAAGTAGGGTGTATMLGPEGVNITSTQGGSVNLSSTLGSATVSGITGVDVAGEQITLNANSEDTDLGDVTLVEAQDADAGRPIPSIKRGVELAVNKTAQDTTYRFEVQGCEVINFASVTDGTLAFQQAPANPAIQFALNQITQTYQDGYFRFVGVPPNDGNRYVLVSENNNTEGTVANPFVLTWELYTGAGGGVTQITAGNGISVSPAGGTGVVEVTATGQGLANVRATGDGQTDPRFVTLQYDSAGSGTLAGINGITTVGLPGTNFKEFDIRAETVRLQNSALLPVGQDLYSFEYSPNPTNITAIPTYKESVQELPQVGDFLKSIEGCVAYNLAIGTDPVYRYSSSGAGLFYRYANPPLADNQAQICQVNTSPLGTQADPLVISYDNTVTGDTDFLFIRTSDLGPNNEVGGSILLQQNSSNVSEAAVIALTADTTNVAGAGANQRELPILSVTTNKTANESYDMRYLQEPVGAMAAGPSNVGTADEFNFAKVQLTNTKAFDFSNFVLQNAQDNVNRACAIRLWKEDGNVGPDAGFFRFTNNPTANFQGDDASAEGSYFQYVGAPGGGSGSQNNPWEMRLRPPPGPPPGTQNNLLSIDYEKDDNVLKLQDFQLGPNALIDETTITPARTVLIDDVIITGTTEVSAIGLDEATVPLVGQNPPAVIFDPVAPTPWFPGYSFRATLSGTVTRFDPNEQLICKVWTNRGLADAAVLNEFTLDLQTVQPPDALGWKWEVEFTCRSTNVAAPPYTHTHTSQQNLLLGSQGQYVPTGGTVHSHPEWDGASQFFVDNNNIGYTGPVTLPTPQIPAPHNHFGPAWAGFPNIPQATLGEVACNSSFAYSQRTLSSTPTNPAGFIHSQVTASLDTAVTNNFDFTFEFVGDDNSITTQNFTIERTF